MRIFSNFDTKLKAIEYKLKQQQYGPTRVLLLSKSNLFRFLSVDLPFLAWVIAGLLLMWAFEAVLGPKGVLYGGLPLFVLSLLFVGPKLFKHMVDYHMDFIIITPDVLYRYDQEWIIKKDIITIHTDSVKAVTVRKRGLLYSLFDNGNIVFLTEWESESGTGEIVLTFIRDPEHARSQVGAIIKQKTS